MEILHNIKDAMRALLEDKKLRGRPNKDSFWQDIDPVKPYLDESWEYTIVDDPAKESLLKECVSLGISNTEALSKLDNGLLSDIISAIKKAHLDYDRIKEELEDDLK